ncbi:MAG: N-acetylmuramoyl-L-alanine amidase CwlD [Peptococcaceae bacterium]|nr:N-acetylmuramoyl-L-alanine amidase CwlD [Peptococcaceae bacterium]
MPSPVRIYVLRGKVLLSLAILALVLLTGYRVAAEKLEKHHIATLAWAVSQKVVVIDPGHGGADPGAVGSAGTYEKDIVLEVAKKLADNLRQSGAQVYLTRDSDQELNGSVQKTSYQARLQDLTRRVEFANQKSADLFVSIHVNSFPDPREGGAQTFSQPGEVESKQLAEAIQQELNRFTVNPGRVAKQVDYFINRKVEMPSVIVEIGFISNPQEEKLLADNIYQEKIAWSIYAGIVRYLSQPMAAMNPG